MLWQPTVLCLSALASHASAELAVRNLPGRSAYDTVGEIRRHLLSARDASGKNGVIFENSTSLDALFEDQKLFEFHQSASVEDDNESLTSSSSITITCTKCYLKGKASAKLTVDGSFNITKAVGDITDSFSDTLSNITSYGLDVIKSINITDLDDFRIPPPDINFDIDLPSLPESHLEIKFQNTEIYVALDTKLSSGLTYTLTLYSSTQLGLQLTKDLFFGVVFSMDLILSVDSEIEISNGFHILMEDDVVMNIGLFAKEASKLSFNGGKFEFLPVQVKSSGTVFTALLRLQIRSGFSFEVFDLGADVEIGDFDLNNLKAGAGIEARVYANVAEFTTNVTNNLDAKDESDCAMHIEQGYQFAIGAAAGASLGILGHTWGPTPATEIPVFYTTLANSCIVGGQSEATSAPTPGITARAAGDQAGFKTTTLTTDVTYQAVGCASTGLVNCPASLQTMTKHVTKSTLVTSVQSGSDATWPTGVPATINAVNFGGDAMSMTGSSGKPTSYVPPPPASTSPSTGASPKETSAVESVINGKTGGVSNKIIIGVSVGIGVPVVVAAVAGACLLWRKKQGSVKPL